MWLKKQGRSNLKKGVIVVNIISNCFGKDIKPYQIVRVASYYCWVRPIAKKVIKGSESDRRVMVKPYPDFFTDRATDKPLKKRIERMDGKAFLVYKSGFFEVWDGKKAYEITREEPMLKPTSLTDKQRELIDVINVQLNEGNGTRIEAGEHGPFSVSSLRSLVRRGIVTCHRHPVMGVFEDLELVEEFRDLEMTHDKIRWEK